MKDRKLPVAIRLLRLIFDGMPPVEDRWTPPSPNSEFTLSDAEVIGIMNSVGNHALADEMQRGLDRRKGETP